MKKNIIFASFVAIVSMFVFTSCCNSSDVPTTGRRIEYDYNAQEMKKSPDIAGEVKTVKAIAVWKQPSAHGTSSSVSIIFSDESYAKFSYFHDYAKMKHHSPFYVNEGDICVIKVAGGEVTFIENKTKQEAIDEYNRKTRC